MATESESWTSPAVLGVPIEGRSGTINLLDSMTSSVVAGTRSSQSGPDRCRDSRAQTWSIISNGRFWVKERSGKYQIDGERLGITGASAGGHLASIVALRNRTPIVAAGVFFPPTDFLDFEGEPIDPRQNGVGELARVLAFPDGVGELSDQEIENGLVSISPARLVTRKAPPFLLIHGDADRVVPRQQSERLVAELQKHDVPVELIVKKGGGHPGLTIPQEVAKMADWFDRQLNAQNAK